MLYKYNTTCGIFPKPHTPKKKNLKENGLHTKNVTLCTHTL